MTGRIKMLGKTIYADPKRRLMGLNSTVLLTGTLLLGLAATSGRADDAVSEKAGLKVGEKAPAFSLNERQGTLPGRVPQKGTVAVVFYRSASW